jgi:DNA repair exonuclease SbcCD ATPase subunit
MILNDIIKEKKRLKSEMRKAEKDLEYYKGLDKTEHIIRKRQLKEAIKDIKAMIKEMEKEQAEIEKTIAAKRDYFDNLPATLYPKIVSFTETAAAAVDDYIQTIKDAYKNIESDIDEYRAKKRDISQHIDLQLSSDLPMQFEPIPNVDMLKIEKIKMMLLDGVAKKQREITHVKKRHERKIQEQV